ncbi:hypothetical protein pb186bvf_020448 [Paramecium bursaria]
MHKLFRGNKICYQFERERMDNIHSRKLTDIQSSLKTQLDQPYGNQNKKHLIMEEKYTEIERENRILLEKIQHIMSGDKRRVKSQQNKRTLNEQNRKRELLKISVENQFLLNRLKNPKVSYDTRHILRQTQKHQVLSQQISDFPTKKRSRSISKRQQSEESFKRNNTKKQILYIGNHKFDDKVYYIQIFTQDSLFKITADESSMQVTKFFEMPLEDGQIVLNQIFHNDIKKLADAIHVDKKIHIEGLEQYEQF